jgi:hypothetical protein
MRSNLLHTDIGVARANALFVSPLQRSDEPGAGQVQLAIVQAIRQFGSRGCAERVAQEFGDHPEIAVARMQWVRQLVDQASHANRAPATRTRPALRASRMVCRAA